MQETLPNYPELLGTDKWETGVSPPKILIHTFNKYLLTCYYKLNTRLRIVNRLNSYVQGANSLLGEKRGEKNKTYMKIHVITDCGKSYKSKEQEAVTDNDDRNQI